MPTEPCMELKLVTPLTFIGDPSYQHLCLDSTLTLGINKSKVKLNVVLLWLQY